VSSLPNNSQIIEPSFGRVEVLKGPGMHRRWSDEEKARIVAETLRPDAVAAVVARRYGIHPNQLYGWRRELRLAAEAEFVPVAVMAEQVGGAPIEVCVNGMVVRVVSGVDLSLFGRVLRIVKAQP